MNWLKKLTLESAERSRVQAELERKRMVFVAMVRAATGLKGIVHFDTPLGGEHIRVTINADDTVYIRTESKPGYTSFGVSDDRACQIIQRLVDEATSSPESSVASES